MNHNYEPTNPPQTTTTATTTTTTTASSTSSAGTVRGFQLISPSSLASTLSSRPTGSETSSGHRSGSLIRSSIEIPLDSRVMCRIHFRAGPSSSSSSSSGSTGGTTSTTSSSSSTQPTSSYLTLNPSSIGKLLS